MGHPPPRAPSLQKERQDASRGGQSVVGHTQVHEEQRETNEYENHPDSWRDHHRKQSAFRPVCGYAGNGSIVGLKRLYRTSLRRLPAALSGIRVVSICPPKCSAYLSRLERADEGTRTPGL